MTLARSQSLLLFLFFKFFCRLHMTNYVDQRPTAEEYLYYRHWFNSRPIQPQLPESDSVSCHNMRHLTASRRPYILSKNRPDRPPANISSIIRDTMVYRKRMQVTFNLRPCNSRSVDCYTVMTSFA